MSRPAVSVAICVLDGRRYIDETLQSVFSQTFQDFQVVFVDDGSTDGTAEYVERTYPDPRLTIVRQSNQTLRVARPVALAHATGEFVAFLDHDDVWLPDKLERQLSVVRQRPEVALVFSDCLIVDERGREIGRLSDQYDLRSMNLAGERAYLELLHRGCFVAYPTAFARASAIREAGGFNPDYQYVSDYDLWLRLARRFAVHCIEEPLAKYRVHGEQFTQRHTDITLAEHVALLRPFLSVRSYPSGVRRVIVHNLFGQHRVAFNQLIREKRRVAAARVLCSSLRYPVPLRDYCHHRLVTSAAGPLFRRAFRAVKHVLRVVVPRARRRRRAEPAPGMRASHVWIDGTCLGREQTGYFTLLSELIRRLSSSSLVDSLHVFADAAGRQALLGRLGPDVRPLFFNRVGWRTLHWLQVYELVCGWRAQLAAALLLAATGVLAFTRREITVVGSLGLLAVSQVGILLDELGARLAAANGRPRLSGTARLVRFLWRRLPAPTWRPGSSDRVELLFWRGRFRWRSSRRVAVVQDVTPRTHPEWHTSSNIAEFDEFVRYVERHSDAVLTVSERSRKDIIAHTRVCPTRVRVLPMPVHPQYYQPHAAPGVPGSYGITGPYILCVGTIEPRKNLRRLVNAFGLLEDAERPPGLVLVLAGHTGWDATFGEFLSQSDAGGRVVLPGFVRLEHLPSLYHCATAVVCPSLYEGFGLPVLEAMCSEALVFASGIDAHRETLGPEGLYFDPYDTQGIANMLRHALALGPAASAAYRAHCRRRAEGHLGRVASGDLASCLAVPVSAEPM